MSFLAKLVFTLTFIAPHAFAGFIGDVSFSEQEKKIHLESINQLTTEAEQCLKQDLNIHQEFYKKYGISAFYGQNSAFAKLSEKEKINFLISKKLDPKLINELKATSCVGLTLKCLEKGFKTTNQTDIYKKLKAFVVLNDVDGTALQYGLRKLGWKTYYWNPNPSKNRTWDLQEKLADFSNKKHFRGFHQENYNSVKNKKRYFMNDVDDSTTLVGFENTEPSLLKQVSFFVGTAHMGYHVFPGSYGIVIEGHSSRAITDVRTIESAPFNPLEDLGAPSGRYRSGMMSLPPIQ